MAYAEIDTELLLLAANGGDHNRAEAYARLQKMRSPELRLLRKAIERLDMLLDEILFERHLRRDDDDE